MENRSTIAVIPARGGSKRLPGKNLMNMAGKPLLAWTIEAALQSGVFDRVFVNTDHPEIAETAIRLGAEVPFLRPTHLAADHSSTVDVLIDHVEKLTKDGSGWTYLACLQPTSPLRNAEDIRKADQLLRDKNADAVISVCRTEHSPLWSNTLPDNLSLEGFIPASIQKTPSQQLPVHYRLNGAIYFCRIEKMILEKTLFLSASVYAYVMSRKNSIDIDDQVDFDLASLYLSAPASQG